MINDNRGSKKTPYGYVVFTDKFLSGWGGARAGRSLCAYAVKNDDEALTVLNNGNSRDDMRHGRFVLPGKDGLPATRLRAGDHLTISDRARAGRWYRCGGFS